MIFRPHTSFNVAQDSITLGHKLISVSWFCPKHRRKTVRKYILCFLRYYSVTLCQSQLLCLSSHYTCKYSMLFLWWSNVSSWVILNRLARNVQKLWERKFLVEWNVQTWGTRIVSVIAVRYSLFWNTHLWLEVIVKETNGQVINSHKSSCFYFHVLHVTKHLPQIFDNFSLLGRS